MKKKAMCRTAGGALVVLVGIGVGLGGAQLLGGAPSSWPDLIAAASTMRSIAMTMLVLAALLVVAGSATIFDLRWGPSASAIAVLVFVIGGFWGNFVLFGDIRPMHTGINVVLGALILLLLWGGSRRAA